VGLGLGHLLQHQSNRYYRRVCTSLVCVYVCVNCLFWFVRGVDAMPGHF